MLRPPASGNRANATVVDAQVQLSATVILYGMRIHSVGFQTPSDGHELVVDRPEIRSWLSFLVQFHDLPLQDVRLAERETHIPNIVIPVDLWVVVTEFLCEWKVRWSLQCVWAVD